MPVAHPQLWQPKIALEIARCSLEKQMSLSPPLGTSDLSLYPYPYSYLHLSWGGALVNLSSSMLGTRPIAYAICFNFYNDPEWYNYHQFSHSKSTAQRDK